MKKLGIFLVSALVSVVALAAAPTFSVWSPGGDLDPTTSTWNSQTIADDAITTDKIDDEAVTNGKIANGTIDLTTKVTGILPEANGGTGVSTLGSLTKTDDTNVTLTLGGTPVGALIQDVSITAGWTGQLGPTRGGTGQAGVDSGDLLYGSASDTWSRLAAGNNGEFLTLSGGLPAWADLPGSFDGFANPSAQIGLSAVNGSATTAMRSDAAPALDQGITPTWTGAHIFSAAPPAVTISNANNPSLSIEDSDAAADTQDWRLRNAGGTFTLSTYTDAGVLGNNAISISRTGTTVDTVNLFGTAITGNGVSITPSEGSFTPTIASSGGGTPAYAMQVGNYMKIGRTVTVQIYITLSSLGTLAAGSVSIGGLPFSTVSSANAYQSCSLGEIVSVSLQTDAYQITAYTPPSGTSIFLLQARNGLGASNVVVGNLSNNSSFIVSCTYLANS